LQAIDAHTDKALSLAPLSRALKLVWRSAPGWTLVNLFLAIFGGSLPLLVLYLLKRIVDEVSSGLAAPDKIVALNQVGLFILAAGGVYLLMALCRSASEFASEAQSLIVSDAVSDALHSQSIVVDLAYYEDPQYHNTLHRAQKEASYRPDRIVSELYSIGRNGLALLGIAALLFSFSWMIGILLLAVALPGALVRLAYVRKLNAFEDKQAETERRAWYYHWMMTDSGHAKDIRLFGLGPLFRTRFLDLRQHLRLGRLALARRRSMADLLAQTLATIAIFGTFTFIAYQTVTGTVTLGSMVMYYQGFQSGLSFIQSVLHAVAGLYEDNLFLSNYDKFLNLAPKVIQPAKPGPIPALIRHGLAFQGVSFVYPSSSQPALQAIDLTVAPGEVVALVGENGSGKTTLIKLLCRLYDPSQGRITLDGIDLRDLDLVGWRRELSVIFQDYVQFYLSARENIWLGNVEREPDEETLTKAARLSGADAVIKRLPQGYDTQLGTWFELGQELSIGEWQKVALARVFLRDSRIVVLDEPTSALDPLAETELFRQFRQLIAGRSAILISHRFSTVQMADCIYVMEHGSIAERGTHRELLELNGLYARLYQAQAQYFTPTAQD